MIAATFVLLALALSSATAANADPTVNVIGGNDVSQAQYTTTYPYMVGLLPDTNPDHQYCGGTLIATQWVMTAAHCYAPAEGANPAYIYIGSENLFGAGQKVAVTGHYIHPNWNPSIVRNDIMLLKLAYAPSPATPAERATPLDDPVGGDLATLIGWGLMAPGDNAMSASILQRATLDVIDQSTCAAEWAQAEGFDLVDASQICAIHRADGGSGIRSGCNGDSGGPLIYGSKVVGIVSFGTKGCYDTYPGVLTRVSSFNSWIDGVRAKTLSVVPESMNFGSAEVGSGAADRTVEFRSDGDSSITIHAAATTGDYTIKYSTCAGALPPQATCQMTVTFNPAFAGVRYGELVLTTDSVADSIKRVPLTGFGFGMAAAPISLKLSLPHKSKKLKKRKLKAKFRVSFALPPTAPAVSACAGLVKLSLKVPRLKKRVRKSGAMKWSKKGCATTLTVKMSSRAKRKKAKATVTFAGNSTIAPAKLIKKIKIR